MGLIANGIDLKTTYNFVVQEINSRTLFEQEDVEIEKYSRVDSYLIDTQYRVKPFSITGYVYGTNLTDARTKKDNLITFLSSDAIMLTFPDTNRSVYAKLIDEPIVIENIGAKLNPVAFKITLNFKPVYPYAFSGEKYKESGAYLYPLKLEVPLEKENFKIVFEPYTVVNLLGSYGSFSVDSDGDGVADGWTQFGSNITVNCSPGKQQITCSNKIGNFGLVRPVTILANNSYFLRSTMYSTTNGPSTNGCQTYIQIGEELLNIASGINQTVTKWSSRKFMSGGTPMFYFLTFTSAVLNGYSYYAEGSRAFLCNLTSMGELPQPLKQFFAPSGITKWEDLATSNNITAYDGTVRTGNDWLNELIPYVDSVATVGGYWDNNSKQFVTSTEKLEIRRNLVDFGQEFVTDANAGTGIWHDSRTLEIWHNRAYGTNGYRIYFNKIPVIKDKTYKYKLKGTHVNSYWGQGEICYFLNWGIGDKDTISRPKSDETKSYTNTDSFYASVYLDFYWTHGIVKDAKLWLDGYEEPVSNDKFVAPLTEPLFGFAGIYDTVTEKSITRFWKYGNFTTNSTGDVGISDMLYDSICIAINRTNGEVKVLTSTVKTVSTGWANTNVTIIYQRETPLVVSKDNFVTMSKLDIGTWYIVNPQFGVSAIRSLKRFSTF